MADEKIIFNNAAGYEQMMGTWSRLAGAFFLDWLGASKNLKWLDVGCGNGAFTEMLVEHCSPNSVAGIDPSEEQLQYARERPACRQTQFQLGDAMQLPYVDNEFDAAAMALVIFFVPEPATSVREMRRVVRSGGWVSAYVWDILEGGFPLAAMQDQLRAIGKTPRLPPSAAFSRMDALRELWIAADLQSVQTTVITVERTFTDFDEYWNTALLGSSIGPEVASLTQLERNALKVGVRDRVRIAGNGQVVISARANAVRGQIV
ncbi:MAG: class I SAM-dependent methyltransferase [Burkholderiales bacterium]|jgi:ubiquinone/menaquinone biosynthesis C-methylase UbiE|nr:class I SAM-dependent methyltransferase [Burkholderiales bacterium]